MIEVTLFLLSLIGFAGICLLCGGVFGYYYGQAKSKTLGTTIILKRDAAMLLRQGDPAMVKWMADALKRVTDAD